MNPDPLISVIVPAHDGGPALARCLDAVRASTFRDFELIVADDASTDGSTQNLGGEVSAHTLGEGVRVVRLARRSGPAAARNAAARVARGSILLFVDADVLVRPDTLARVAARFRERPDLSALFGSYDDAPAAHGFVSRYKNLQHHYVHQRGSREAETFWAGCGAVRRDAFERAGGFDEERYREPSIEDIELGYRLRRAGRRILLDRELQVKHLKRWTLPSLLRADIFRRAVPWSRLILERRGMINDLNLRARERACAALVASAAALSLLSVFKPALLLACAAALAAVAFLNRELYAFFLRRGGAPFAAAAFALHALYYLYSGATFALVWAAHKLSRGRARGAVPGSAA